jgi:hypothetical protein
MRIRWLFFTLWICTTGSGCTLFVQAARDLSYEAQLRLQETREELRNKELADKAWLQACQGNAHSPDHGRGFKDGFADYLRGGGTGLPPPLPPRQYWAFKYQTPEGHKAIEEWYAGYRDGAAAARETGLRQLVTVPTHSALLPPQPPPLPGPPLALPSPLPLVGPVEEMPLPKQGVNGPPPPAQPIEEAPAPKHSSVGGLAPPTKPAAPARPGGLAPPALPAVRTLPDPVESPQPNLRSEAAPMPQTRPVLLLQEDKPPAVRAPAPRLTLELAPPRVLWPPPPHIVEDGPNTISAAVPVLKPVPPAEAGTIVRPAEDAFRHIAPAAAPAWGPAP